MQYDMMGANIPSIAQFKASFGGELQTYTYASKDTTWSAYFGRKFYLYLAPQIQGIRLRLRSLTNRSLAFLAWISHEAFGLIFDCGGQGI
jgi:hypothetical protein